MNTDSQDSIDNTTASLIRSLDLLSCSTEALRDMHRAEVVRALSQARELSSTASVLTRGDTYRVVLSQPARGGLNTRADGLLDAFVKGEDGKILAVARLQKAGSALVSSATALAGHAMLVQVSAQIERLQGTVEQVLIKMDAARLGKVDAALVFLSHAHHYRPEHQVPTLLHAAQTLSDVLGEALRDVAQGIGAVPEPQEWNLTRAVWDTTGRTAEALDRAAASMRAALMCLTVLWQVHLRLNDKDGAAGVIKDWLRRMLDLPLAQAEFLARRLPIVRKEDRRDRFWIDAQHVLGRALEKVEDVSDPDRPMVVQFEATGAQIADAPTFQAPGAAPAASVEAALPPLSADPA